MRLILFVFFLATSAKLSAQTPIFSWDFEGINTIWVSNGTFANNWAFSSCPGNGPTFVGSNAAYVTSGQSVLACGAAHDYINSVSGVQSTIISAPINATCDVTALTLNFDYKVAGNANDFGAVVYSLDNGLTWVSIQNLASSVNFVATSISLPAVLQGVSFRLGFQFTYDNVTTNGIPLAIDNVQVTIIDATAPTISCIPVVDAYANLSCQGILADVRSTTLPADNCSPVTGLTIIQNPGPGSTVTQGQVVTFTVVGGGSCTSTVLIIDTINPVVACPTLITANANTSCNGVAPNYAAVVLATDNCTSGALLTFNQIPAAGAVIANNAIITVYKTDASGNIGSCAFAQALTDTNNPIINCPINQSIYLNATCSALLPDFYPLATSSDNCSSISNLFNTQSPAVGTTVNGVGSQVITLQVTDQASNIGTCTFTLTRLDTIRPAVVCPASINFPATANCEMILSGIQASLVMSDNCTPTNALVYSQLPAAGTVVSQSIASQIVVISVSDASGNVRTCNTTALRVDAIAPIITSCASNQQVVAGANCLGALPDFTSMVTATDNCTSSSSLVKTQIPAIGSLISATTSVTVTVTDLAGNNSSCNFTATLQDTSNPTINCADTLVLNYNATCIYTIPNLLSNLSASDNCTATSSIFLSQVPSASTTSTGFTPITISATDQAGNTTTCITVLEGNDVTAPSFICLNNTTINNGSLCTYTLPDYISTIAVFENCSGFTFTQNPVAGTIVQTGITPVFLQVVDIGGNQFSCSFNLSVIENSAPVFLTCPANISTCNPVVNFNTPTVSDNCSQVSVIRSDLSTLVSGNTFPIGITPIQYKATDSSGNFVFCNFTIEVLAFPSNAVISDNSVNLCSANSFALNATPVTSGIGNWSILSGSGIISNPLSNPAGINNLMFGTTIVEWTISTPNCGFKKDTIIINNSELPLVASAQDTIYACSSLYINLVANPASAGMGTWSTTSGVDFSNLNSPSIVATVLNQGWNTAIWTITNGGCPPSRDTVDIFKSIIPEIANSDTTFCENSGSLLINGSAPGPSQTSDWSTFSVTGQVTNPSPNQLSISTFAPGIQTIVLLFSHPVCSTTSDSMTIIVEKCIFGDITNYPTMFTPNNDGKNDLLEFPGLNLNNPNCNVVVVNRWGSIVFESDGYKSPWNGEFKGNQVPVGAYFYTIRKNNLEKEVVNGTISIMR